jgi:uncharacterized membrane protein
MTVLLIGIVLFFGVHSVRIVAGDWRQRQMSRLGARAWKGIYSLASLVGIVMVGYGYAQTRRAPVDLWNPPAWLYPITSVLMLVAFVLIAAAYVRGNRIKAKVGQPFAAGVKTWAFAHLLSNGRLGDVILFGAFLVWAIAAYVAAQKRDRAAGVVYPIGPASADVKTVVAGLVGWVVFGFWLHALLIGVRPF